MTEEIKTCNNNQKMSVYCKTCVCKSCEQVARLEQENNSLQAQLNNVTVQSNNAITALEQENKELHSVLEEIHLILDELKQQYDYMADYSEIKEIQDKINGVLE